MKCSKCGNELMSGAVFCDNCGNKVEFSPAIVCPKCGSKCASGTEYCGECGTKIVPSSASGAASATSKRICPSCKCEWDNDVMFCGECGTATIVKTETLTVVKPVTVTEVPMTKKCPECGSELDAIAEFCGNCGFDLKETVVVHSDTASSSHSVKSTMRETVVDTDPLKAENDKRGNSFFSKAGEIE